VRLGKHLMLKRSYLEKLLKGEKRATLRLGIVVPTSRRVYLHSDGRIVAEAEIEDVIYKRVEELTDEDAKADGFSSREELLEELKRLYGARRIRRGSTVSIIRIRILRRLDLPEEHVYACVHPLEIARTALERLKLNEEEALVLKTLVESGSVRKAAAKLHGGKFNRKRIREVLRNALKRLLEGGYVEAKC